MTAIFHAAKFMILSLCHTAPIRSSDLVRGSVSFLSSNLFRAGARYEEWLAPSSLRLAPTTSSTSSIPSQTDKHHMVWMIQVVALKRIVQEHWEAKNSQAIMGKRNSTMPSSRVADCTS